MHWIKPLIGLLLLSGVSSQALYATPFVPTDDQQILETLPTDSPTPLYLNSDSFASGAIAISPEQTSQLLERAYLEGDPRALGQARAQLDQSTDQSIEIQMLRARALQSDHKFSQAKALLEQILAKEPANPDALLTLSSLQVVQGQFDAAMSHCEKLSDASLRVYQLACVAQIQSMTGQLTEAKQTLSGLASLASGLDPSTARWIYLMQADAALRSKDVALNTQLFSVMDTETVPALMARADWLLKNGQYQQVRELLKDHTDKDALLLRLITAQIKLKDPAATNNLALMKERIGVWEVRKEKAHIRDQATYALLSNQVDSALELARENWEKQRETADILIYATAAIKANSQKDIKIIQQYMTDTKFEYPALERDLRLGKIGGCTDCQAANTQASAQQSSSAISFGISVNTKKTVMPLSIKETAL